MQPFYLPGTKLLLFPEQITAIQFLATGYEVHIASRETPFNITNGGDKAILETWGRELTTKVTTVVSTPFT